MNEGAAVEVDSREIEDQGGSDAPAKTTWEAEIYAATHDIADPVERREEAARVRREQDKYRRRVLQALGRK